MTRLEQTLESISHQRLWERRIGFSFALEAVCREIAAEFGGEGPHETLTQAIALRETSIGLRLPKNVPTFARDRFAFYTQTLGLPRDEVDQLRKNIFE